MKCSSCNSILKSIEYQARSADEAQRSILRCPNCPVNIDEFAKKRVSVHIHLAKRQRTINSTPLIKSSTVVYKRFICARAKSSTINVDISNVYPIFASNYIDEKGHMFRYYHNGQWANQSVYISSKTQMGPNIKLVNTSNISGKQCPSTRYKIHDSVTFDNKEYIIIGDHVSVWLPIQSNTQIFDKIEELYLMGFSPISLLDCMGQTLLGSLSNLSARAYDKYSVPDHSFKFSTKPDGQRLWMTKIGMIWLFSERLKGHRVVGWKLDTDLPNEHNNQIGPVIDVEYVYGFGLILIDVLMTEKTNISNDQRTLEYINTEFSTMRTNFPLLKSIHIRQFFNTYMDASKYRETVPYPTDGIVAISNSGTDMFKIKSEKSMELELMEDGTLYTSDCIPLFSSDCRDLYDTGTIIEVRFSIRNSILDIKNVFHRPDKQRANDMEAVNNIIESCMRPSDDIGNILRTEIWRWSNNLRSSLYESVHKTIKGRGVVLDIGTGDGQSVDALMSMENVSFVFVEPDPLKCKRLIKKLDIRRYHTDPRSIIPIVSRLKRGDLKYHVLNCTMDKIMSDEATVQNLKYTVDYCTACFSAQFVIDHLETMSDMGVNVIGSCYLYDDIDIDGSIIDDHGLKMCRIDETTAQVKWGTDKTFTEPAIESEDIPNSLTKIRASNLIGNPTDNHHGILTKLCSHVWILRSN